MQNDDTPFEPSRRERLITMAVTGLTLLLIGLAGYFTPTVLSSAL